MYSSIWTALKAILDPLITTTTLTAVYNYDVKTYNTFPALSIVIWEWEETYLDTANNEANINFLIRIVDQNKDVSSMEARMRTLVDNILVELRKKSNSTLWWIAEWITFKIIWWWQDLEMPIRVCEITCIVKIVNTVI